MKKLEIAINHKKNGEFEEYNKVLRELIKEEPQNPIINYHYAWSFDLISMESKAIKYYETAIECGLDGEDLQDAYLGLGSSYRTLGKYEKSKEVFCKAIKKFPNDNALKTFYAMTLYNLRRNEDAMEILLNIISETSSDDRVIKYKKSIEFYADKLSTIWE